MLHFCKISVLTRDEIKPPFFIGSQIRGALGYALKSIVCVKDNTKCEECDIAKSCVFFDFYGAQNVYHHFCLDFKLGMPRYDFNIYIFGKAIENAPMILSALHKMLCEVGLESSGKRLRFKNIVIFVNDKFCFCNDDIKMPLDFRTRFDIGDKFKKRIKLTLTTPLRIKKNNIFIRDDSLEISDIFRSINNRKLSILGKEREKMPKFSGTITTKNLHFVELYRKSQAQRTKMNFGGLMGELIIDDLDKDSYALLKIGELIGVGKQCVFGLGRLRVDELSS